MMQGTANTVTRDLNIFWSATMSLDNNIRSFDDLLQAARLQPLPQRLLFVFTSRGISDRPNPAQKARYEQGTGGELTRSEEHTSELQSRGHLVCRLLLEKK